VDGLTEAVRSQLTARYGLEVTLKEPKPRKYDEASAAVDTWQITVVTNPNQNHRPHQRIKIDIATMETVKVFEEVATFKKLLVLYS